MLSKISDTIEQARVDELFLDSRNPRIGKENQNASQEEVLEIMRGWSLEELAVSFIENGFWPQEALLVIEEEMDGENGLVVVEGNRRLAALKLLLRAADGQAHNRTWENLADEATPSRIEELKEVPILRAADREAIQEFLGFRHVTGIKQWKPVEKAEYITHLVDDIGMGYREAMRKIGSKTPTVRKHYIAYKLLEQARDTEGIQEEYLEERFSVLYRALDVRGVQEYLGLDLQAEPGEAQTPVDADHEEELGLFAQWMFGDAEHAPLFTDSRLVNRFGEILVDEEALAYLQRNEEPNFERAYRISGGSERQMIRLLNQASDNVQQVLGRVHHHKDSEDLHKAASGLRTDVDELEDRLDSSPDSDEGALEADE